MPYVLEVHLGAVPVGHVTTHGEYLGTVGTTQVPIDPFNPPARHVEIGASRALDQHWVVGSEQGDLRSETDQPVGVQELIQRATDHSSWLEVVCGCPDGIAVGHDEIRDAVPITRSGSASSIARAFTSIVSPANVLTPELLLEALWPLSRQVQRCRRTARARVVGTRRLAAGVIIIGRDLSAARAKGPLTAGIAATACWSGSADFGQGALHRVGEPLDDLVEVVSRGVVRRGDDDRVATPPVDIAAHRVADQSVVE